MQILYDFRHELGIDVLDYFTGERSWFEFYDFLHELPRWGKFKSALEMDEEFARHIHEQRRQHREEQEDWDDEDEEDGEFDVKTRSGEGYTPLLARIDTLDERIQSLTNVFIKLNSKSKPPPLQRALRPVTMIDAMEKMEERDEMHELAASFGFGKTR